MIARRKAVPCINMPGKLTLACHLFCAGLLAAGGEQERKADEVFKVYTAQGSPGCAVGVIQDGKVVHSKGYGMADLEQGVAISPKSVFYMGSVSKQFMAFAILTMEKQGKLTLDDSIRKHVPELPDAYSPVTLRHLLHHTSGARDYLTLGMLAGYSPDHVWTERAALRMIARQRALNFEPGAEHLYSNSGYVLLSLAAQRAAGEKLNEWSMKHLFGPLGMAASRWQHNHSDPIPNRAHGYARSMLGAWQVSDSMIDTVGGGGMYSSVEDMLKWAGNFLSGATGGELLARMAEPGKLRDGTPLANGYGMGLMKGSFRGTQMISHGGALAGYRTHFLALPEKRLAVVCLCNMASALPQRLSERVAGAWLEGELGEAKAPDAPKPPAQPKLEIVPADLQREILGAWWSDELQAVYQFVQDEGKLTVEVGDNTRAVVVMRENGALQASMGQTGFNLRRGADGKVHTILLDAGRVRGIELKRSGRD